MVRKKLIEVALPLDSINATSVREKSIRHGHPATLHLWWSRKPTATARVVIFAQMVDNPASVPEEFPTPEAQERERQRQASLNVRADSGEKNTRHPAGLMVLPEVFPSRRKYKAPDGRPGALWADAGSTSDPGTGQGAG